jgi:hypothetical protein
MENPTKINGYTVRIATLEVNPGNWQGSFVAEKPNEPPLTSTWNPQFYTTQEEAERATLEMSRTMLGGII